MIGFVRFKKSGGRFVGIAVHRLIRRGDAARDADRWIEAASAYRAALTEDPTLHHIRMQLGHASKEAGSWDDADAIYAEAARNKPEDPEPVRHRAHLARRRGLSRAAARLFVSAALRGGEGSREENDLCRLLELGAGVPISALRALLREREAEDRDAGGASLHTLDTSDEAEEWKPVPSGERPLLFDITDLVGHLHHSRLPTGIQRVQIEVLSTALETLDAAQVALCCFVGGRDACIMVPVACLLEVAALATIGSDTGDPTWALARARLFFELAFAAPLRVPPRALLINLGMSLWVRNYFLFIRTARERHGLAYLPLVHDLVPITAPQYCVPGLVEDFSAWIAGVFDHADALLTYACWTKAELGRVAAQMGRSVSPDRIEVVPLDAEFLVAGERLPPSALARWNLVDTPFALLVATIEPRKNHILAFEAWAELIRRHGVTAVPRLVCVGRDGWMNDAVYERLAADQTLLAAVTIIHRASDAELALLYGGSRFTVYPSLLEGWGLPVTESLCHGKVPVVADNSTLPEAGAGFARLFESGSIEALVAAVEQVAFDHAWRTAEEQRIAAEFRPRPWRAVATQVIAAARRFGAHDLDLPMTPEVRLGRYYRLERHRTPELWPGMLAGEAFRVGEGWFAPDGDGCRIAEAGAELAMRVNGLEARSLKLHLLLRGLPTKDCPVLIETRGGTARAIVGAGETAWLSCDLPVGGGAMLRVRIQGLVAEAAQDHAGSLRPASVRVLGFLLADAADGEKTAIALAGISLWRDPRL